LEIKVIILVQNEEVIAIGVYIVDEETLEKKSIIRQIYGILTTLVIVFLVIGYTGFIAFILSQPKYITFLTLAFYEYLNVPMSQSIFIGITFLLLLFLLGSLLYLFLNKRMGLLKEIRGFGKRYIFTFSEAFYISFFGSFILIFLLPLTQPTNQASMEVIIFYAYFATSIAPVIEETVFRMAFLLVPIAIKEKFWKNKEKSFLVVLQGKDRLDNIDMILLGISSLAFGLAHYFGGWEFNKVFQATFLGLFLGYVALRGGIFSSITFHWTWNILSTLVVIIHVIGAKYQPLILLIIGFLYLIVIGLGVIALITSALRFFTKSYV